MEEIELIKQVQEGNMQAFEALFELYKQKAIKTAYLMTGDQTISEDIVQEAFTTCYLSIKKLKHPEYFKTWFFKLLTRIAWRAMKKEKVFMPVAEIYEMMEEQAIKNQTYKLQEEEDTLVYEEILKLNIKLQTTLILYYYNELNIKEISKVMGCLEGTVKSRLHTGRMKLKENLIKKQHSVQPKEELGYEI